MTHYADPHPQATCSQSGVKKSTLFQNHLNKIILDRTIKTGVLCTKPSSKQTRINGTWSI